MINIEPVNPSGCSEHFGKLNFNEHCIRSLSYTQERYWLLSLYEPENPAYHCFKALRLKGFFDTEVFRESILKSVKHHRVLCSVFTSFDNIPQQQFIEIQQIYLENYDLTSIHSIPEKTSRCNDSITSFINKPFDLSKGPLFRIAIIQLSPLENILCIVMHKIIADERSLNIFIDDISRFYSSVIDHKEIGFSVPKMQFADFVNLQRIQLSEKSNSHIAFWKDQLNGELPIFQFFSSHPRPTHITYSSNSLRFEISDSLLDKTASFSDKHSLSRQTIIFAAYLIALHRHTGQDDIIIGYPVSGRSHPDTGDIIGRFSTVLPLRSRYNGKSRFAEFAQELQLKIDQIISHQDVPLERILEELKIPSDLSRHPLFQVTYECIDETDSKVSFHDLDVTIEPINETKLFFDISLSLGFDNNSIAGILKFNSALFTDTEMSAFVNHIKELLDSGLTGSKQKISDLNILREQERDLLIVNRNKTAKALSFTGCIHELFEKQVSKTPDKTAVRCGDSSLTFSSLNSLANYYASTLINNGFKAGDRAAICMESSIDIAVAILAILKAGGVYVPIDPAYPHDRQTFMAEDAQVNAILTQNHILSKLPESKCPKLCVDSALSTKISNTPNPNLQLPEDSLIYMIFTSGSTGKPKGSLVYHRGFVNLVQWYIDEFHFNEQSRFLIISSLSFDLTQKNLFAPLCCGGELVFTGTTHYDAEIILDTIEQKLITSINCTPSAFYGLLSNNSDSSIKRLNSLQYVFLGGEPISVTRLKPWTSTKWFNALVVNSYGPTECTDVCAFHRLENLDDYIIRPVPIGRPVSNTELYILDENLNLVPDGAPGELFIGGIGVGAGYVNRPELTAQKFINNPLGRPGLIYRTGDRVLYRHDGVIEFLGRNDHQVKIRGYRIELDEIAAAIQLFESVKECYVMAVDDTDGEKRIVAYIVWHHDKTSDFSQLRSFLNAYIPGFMIPSLWVELDNLPLTPNGKVDRSRLPKPQIQQAAPEKTIVEKRSPNSQSLEQFIELLWRDILQLKKISKNDRFFEIGGTSLKAIQFIGKICKELAISVPVVKLFEAPTIFQFSEYLRQSFKSAVESRFTSSITDEILSPDNTTVHNSCFGGNYNHRCRNTDIAIIGMAVRYPGAKNIDEFWENLRNGVESIRQLTDEELLARGVDPQRLSQPNYVKASACMDDVESFDASFFGYNPREIQLMDPQHRAILECAWSALEHSGYVPDKCELPVSVFCGVARDSYLTNNLITHSEILNATGDYSVMIGNEKDFPATRVAYKLNLHGPSVNIQTACSSSGVGVHYAIQGLNSEDCEIALVGGCRILLPANTGYMYIDGGTLSPDGHVRAFDAKAQGMVRGSGVGFIVLKQLEKALSDGDSIYAVIKSTAINNDGSDKAGFTAPSVNGQAEVISKAIEKAAINPETVSYIEAHGTGTSLGDPIEVSALTKAFRKYTDKKCFCAIGSVKTNIGHLDAGSCVAGIIKTALSLYNKEIPPSLNFEEPNPQIDFASSPFFVNTALRKWPEGSGPIRAGVSSFGLGGTNVHVILEEAPVRKANPTPSQLQLLPISAKTPTALNSAAENLCSFFLKNKTADLADTAFTLQTGRRHFPYRKFIISKSTEDAVKQIVSASAYHAELESPSIVFMFPGQGSQHVNMGKDLYQTEPLFKRIVDECTDILQPLLNIDLRNIIFPPETTSKEQRERLNQTGLAQPALFTIEYALAQLWISRGVKPDVMVGHSVGEYVAACCAGVFTLKDALTVLAKRAQLMQSMPSGSMRAVRIDEENVKKYLSDDVSVAAVNAPELCIVSGTHNAINYLDTRLASEGITSILLHTSHAFHSRMMLPVLPGFIEILSKIKFEKPKIPIISTHSGTWMNDEDAINPNYWARQLIDTVKFSAAVKELLKDQNRIFLEVGPSTNLSSSVRQHLSKENSSVIINSLPHASDPQPASESFLYAFGRLWASGFEVPWYVLHGNLSRYRIGLPTYPFERKRFWIDPAEVTVQHQNTFNLKKKSEVSPINERISYMISQAKSLNQSASSNSDANTNRLEAIASKLRDLFINLSGAEIGSGQDSSSFFELGMDSLLLTQAASKIKTEFSVDVKFRQLVDDCSTIAALAEHINKLLPPEKAASYTPTPSSTDKQQDTQENINTFFNTMTEAAEFNSSDISYQPNSFNHNTVTQVISQQIQLMSRQLELLTGKKKALIEPVGNLSCGASANLITPVEMPAFVPVAPQAQSKNEEKKFVGPALRINKTKTDTLSPRQKSHLNNLIERYNRKTRLSKEFTQKHRKFLADPRAVAGFRPLLKELIYPIVVNKSEGSKLWDIDGNQYIDMLNGFGSNFFGHKAPFVIEAVEAQMKTGIEIGPQHPLSGELAELLCDFLGKERVAFCNTGSEAVLGAMRIARTVTGRDKIAMFVGAYHGIFDEVIVRGTKNLTSMPAAPGIQPGAVDNIIVIDYGTSESLEILRSHAHELAAILVEPVQSRMPELQPKEFLQELRTITEASGTALIFDEVVTGFRVGPRGAQGHFGIEADIATYGKVLGGGMNIGVIAGKSNFLDALDGGFWNYGDESIPEVGVTYFAGTFVRHPPVLVAAKAVVNFLKEQGPQFQNRVNENTAHLVSSINSFCENMQIPLKLNHFASIIKISFTEEIPFSELLFVHLREKGVHIWDHRPVYMTAAHTEDDLNFVINAFKESIQELQAGEFLPKPETSAIIVDASKPPRPGARLGRDSEGNPAWFIPDPERPGKYLQLGDTNVK